MVRFRIKHRRLPVNEHDTFLYDVVSKPLPQDNETERALLGAILIYNELIIQVSGLLSSDDFFVDLHGKVFQHMVMLSMKGAPIDEITLKDSLDAAGAKDTVSLAFLSGLADGAPRLQNVSHYADIRWRCGAAEALTALMAQLT